jgi:hypothetical protein
MRFWSILVLAAGAAVLGGAVRAQGAAVQFTVRSARSGAWSDAQTWVEKRVPRAGDCVQVHAGHRVVYDARTEQPLRVVHVAGILAFSREKSTRLDVGLLKIQAGDTITEDGFECDAHAAATPAGSPERPALEIGTADQPIPAGVTAQVRLAYFEGMNRETLPAIINCGGRWDIHGAPLSRTWVKLGSTAPAGSARVTLSEPVTGWRVGDRVIVTGSRQRYSGGTFRKPGGGPAGDTEERLITGIQGTELTLDQPLQKEHRGEGMTRSEVADLSRNVVVESADPQGVRGHTMYHLNSTGGVSYAEFRHLGKENVLGKYSLHFHLVRDSMRGSGVLGASIWDSANRWITVHGTDYLLVRDCVGYQSVGHGFFLEDGTEQYNVFDRNLAVQAYRGKRLPKQVLPFDPNDGAGFWWANGRNTFTRNVSCENDEYGYRFEIAKRSNFDPELSLLDPQGRMERRDIRTVPFLRFEDNESHSEGLYSFNFGDDVNPGVRGDRQHPFTVRNLRAWETHYTLRPNLQFFLADGVDVDGAVYGVYHPDYDAHVYRNIRLRRVTAEPINRGHDDDSIQYGSFTYENLKLEDCRVGRDPLIQLTCTSPRADAAGHFRGLEIRGSTSQAKVVDLGGGPRNPKLENPVPYYFHDYPAPGRTLRVVSARFPMSPDYRTVEGFTGPDVRAAEVPSVPFPQLLDPVDDLPPATLITSVRTLGKTLLVRGVTQDNGDLASVTVNDRPANLLSTHAGVTDWEIRLDAPAGGALRAFATDRAGNTEKLVHSLRLP